MELQSIDEEMLSSILIHKNSVIHLSEEELRQYKLQLAMCKKAYNNFVNSKELYRLSFIEQEKAIKRAYTINVMYSELCIEWDKRLVTKYKKEKRELLCAL